MDVRAVRVCERAVEGSTAPHAFEQAREARALLPVQEKAQHVGRLGVRDVHLPLLLRESSVEVAEGEQLTEEGRVPELAHAVNGMLPRFVDGQPFVEPERHMTATQRVVERDVTELVVKDSLQVGRAPPRRLREREEHEARGHVRHPGRVGGHPQLAWDEGRQVFPGSTDADLDGARKHVLPEVGHELRLPRVGLLDERLHASTHARGIGDRPPAERLHLVRHGQRWQDDGRPPRDDRHVGRRRDGRLIGARDGGVPRAQEPQSEEASEDERREPTHAELHRGTWTCSWMLSLPSFLVAK